MLLFARTFLVVTLFTYTHHFPMGKKRMSKLCKQSVQNCLFFFFFLALPLRDYDFDVDNSQYLVPIKISYEVVTSYLCMLILASSAV